MYNITMDYCPETCPLNNLLIRRDANNFLRAYTDPHLPLEERQILKYHLECIGKLIIVMRFIKDSGISYDGVGERKEQIWRMSDVQYHNTLQYMAPDLR